VRRLGEGWEVESRLETSRREAEDRLAAIQDSMTRELGVAPERPYLLLLLAAGAAGFAFALRRATRRPSV
jgi:hypothetical protein